MERLALLGGRPAIAEGFPPHPVLGDAEYEAVATVMRSGELSEGSRRGPIAAFENALCRYFDVPYALSFNSGTAALHAALWAVGVTPGSRVLTANNTWLSAIAAILHANAVPVLCDVEANETSIGRHELVQRIDEHTSAVIVTHMWGLPAPMFDLMAEANARGVPIIEDVSHAHGALINGRRLGTLGEIGCFSLQNSKPIVAGEGGFLLTRSKRLYLRAQVVGHFGPRLLEELGQHAGSEGEIETDLLDFTVAGPAYKYRMSPIAAAIARCQLARLNEINAARSRNFEHLKADLSNETKACLRWLEPRAASSRGWYALPALYESAGGPSRDLFEAACRAEGIPLLSQYADWARTPLFQRRDLLTQFWPISAYASRFHPVSQAELPNDRYMRQRLVLLSVPSLFTPRLMERIGCALNKVAGQMDVLASWRG